MRLSLRLIKAIFCAGSISVFCAVGFSEVRAEIIKLYTFESGNFSGIGRHYQDRHCSAVDGGLFRVVTAPVRAGRYASRHAITNCDERSELVIPKNFFRKDNEYWIGWSYYIPTEFHRPGKKSYTVIQQMMSYTDVHIDQRSGQTLFECNRRTTRNGREITVGAPASEMTVSASGTQFTYQLKYYRGQDSQSRYIFGCRDYRFAAETDRWQDFVMHVKFTSDREGFIRMWRNGQLIVDERVALIPPDKEAMGSWKVGLYVGNPGNGERLLYIDEIRVGDASSSYEEVMPHRDRQGNTDPVDRE